MTADDPAVEEWETYIEEAIAFTSDRDELVAKLREVIRANREVAA